MAKTNRQQIIDIDTAIAKLQGKRQELEVAAANEIDISKVVQGAAVSFNYGKAPNVKSLDGLVLGVKHPEAGVKGGSFVRVAVGDGFEAQIVTVSLTAVTKVLDVEAAVAAENPAE